MNGENKVKFGLTNVHYAILQELDDGGVSFGTPVRIPGAVSLALAAQGDQEVFYADNIAYYTTSANDGYQGDLEIAIVPDSFRQDVLGEQLNAKDKVLVENAAAEGKAFALLYQFAGDKHNTLRVLYNCKASRPGENGSTNQKSKTPKTDTLTITASPLPDGNVRAKSTADTPKAVLDEWFKSVWLPTVDQDPEDQGQDEEGLDQNGLGLDDEGQGE